MTIQERKTFVVNCDWRDTEGNRCVVTMKPVLLSDPAEVEEDVRRRGWASTSKGQFCCYHSSAGVPYVPLKPYPGLTRMPPPPEVDPEELSMQDPPTRDVAKLQEERDRLRATVDNIERMAQHSIHINGASQSFVGAEEILDTIRSWEGR